MMTTVMLAKNCAISRTLRCVGTGRNQTPPPPYFFHLFPLIICGRLTRWQESYEIGSENDPVQQNIWLPEDVLPQFSTYETALYERLAGVSKVVLDAIGVGLGLDVDATAALKELILDRHCQLRLLHYPAISKDKLENELLARLPAHNDWG